MASQLTQLPDTPVNGEIDYSTQAPKILAISGVLTGLSLVVVALRCYVRVFILRRFYAEDSIMVVCGICCIGFMACLIGESKVGMGQYMAAIEAQSHRGKLSQWIWWRSLIVVLGISLVKVSVGLFLLRFTTQRKWLRWFIVGSCVPVRAAWDSELRKKESTRCFTLPVFLGIGRFNASISIITDFFYATLPIFMFYNVQVNRRTKISLMGVLGLGYFACAAAIVKTVFQTRYFSDKEVYREYTYHIWNYVELATGIIAASFPTIKPLVKSIIGSTRGQNTRSRSRSYGHGRSRKHTAGEQASYYGPNSHALSALARSRQEEEMEDKYRVQIHAAHPSLSLSGSGSDGGSGSEENLNSNLARPGARRQRQSVLDNNTRGIVQTTEVIVYTESADADMGGGLAMIGPRRTVEDRI
ncbi:uncharacterized protein BDV17DRAFT_299392 [Aspergillus undulatus]|uniref:uncharacterized protein n=1 Tax=Aspergillus undulatus TaxID=1810928 RepID=UPI003CCD8E17